MTPDIIMLEEMRSAFDPDEAFRAIEKALVDHSNGTVITPPIGCLSFDKPPGDFHLKYGYLKGDPFFVVKAASSFYDNPVRNIASSQGLMLLFSAQTGCIQAILLDEGYLTDLRTALAGAVAAKHLAPPHIKAIGILGTGTQAKLQLEHLKAVTDCRRVYIWGRHVENAKQLAKNLPEWNFTIAATPREVAQNAQLIVTTTPSKSPLLTGADLLPGTHITAVGTDQKGKSELDFTVFEKASIITADSISQCQTYGDLANASPHLPIIELGQWIQKPKSRPADAISISDLTGIAAEDIHIAKIAYQGIQHARSNR